MHIQRTLRMAAAVAVFPVLIGCASSQKQQTAQTSPDHQWTSVGLGGGGGIFCPVSSPHDPNLMFCSSDMSGVYRSTDAGRTWRMIPYQHLSGAITDSIVFHPKNENVMYCLPGGHGKPVLKISTDKGLTWQAVTEVTPWHGQSPCAPKFAIDPSARVMLVGSDKGLFRSEDGGRTWMPAFGIDKQVIGYAFDAGRAARYWYVATADAVYRSEDAGRTWKPAPGQPDNTPINDFCGGSDPQTGQTALYVTTPSKEANGRYAGGIYRSEDRSQTWQGAMGEGINTQIGPHNDIERKPAEYPYIAMATDQTQTLYAYCYGNGTAPPLHSTVYRTDDGGRSWRCVEYFRPEWEGSNVEWSWIRYDRGTGGRKLGFAVNPADSDIVMYTDMMELYLTTNGGQTWRQAYTRCADGEPGPGKAWTSVGLEMTTTWHYKIDPHNADRHYICYTDIGFARSTDAGKTWYWAAEGSPWQNTFYDIEFDPQVPDRIYAACAYEHDIPAWKMAGRVYGGGGVCLSTDAGATWTPIADGFPEIGACTGVEIDPNSPVDARVLYASFYGGGVYKSVDGGKSWQAKNNGLPVDVNNHFTDIRLHEDGTLLALCGGKRIARYHPEPTCGLFKSTDGGETWVHLTKNVPMYLPYGFDVQQDDSNVIWLGVSAVPRHHDEAGLYRTTDGGKTWQRLQIEWPPGGPSWVHVHWPSIDPSNPDRVWVGTGTHGMIMTEDGGNTWRLVDGIPFGKASRVLVDPADPAAIWVTTFGGGVWRGPASPDDGPDDEYVMTPRLATHGSDAATGPSSADAR